MRIQWAILLWAACLASATLSLPAAEDPVLKQAYAMAHKGQFEQAVAALRASLTKQPDQEAHRILLGRLLDHTGQPEEAVAVWKAGLQDKPADFALLMHMAGIRKRQGDDGPGVTYDRGSVSYGPSKDEAGEAAYKQKHLELAAALYARAAACRIDDPAPRFLQAETLVALKKVDEAAKIFEALLKHNPQDADALNAWAAMLATAKQTEPAREKYEQLLKLDPRQAQAYQYLADYYTAQQKLDQAKEHQDRAQYYTWLPPFVKLEFTAERLAVCRQLDDKSQKQRVARIDALIADGSLDALWFLSAVCMHHRDHGPVEQKIYAALVKAGPQAVPILMDLARGGCSTCTTKSTFHALAKLKAREAFDLIVEALPNDLRAYWYFDAAGALAELGDERAVAPLIESMAPDLVQPVAEDDPMQQAHGRLLSRVRAALALGSFDTQTSRAALAAGLKNEQLAPACHAALYMLTKEEAHLRALEVALRKNEYEAAHGVAQWCDERGDEKTRALADAWIKAREAEREARKKE